MMNRWITIISFLMLILSGCVSLDNIAEDKEFDGGVYYTYGNGNVTFSVDNTLMEAEVDSLLSLHDLSLAESDSLLRYSENKVARSGWTLTAFDELLISYAIPLAEFNINGDISGSQIILGERIDMIDRNSLDVPFGINSGFKGVDPGPTRKTKFVFSGASSNQQVYLSGTFNNWSTLSHAMKFTGDSWELELDLEPGKYLYRYVVDGKWTLDPINSSTEVDARGMKNSVLFVYNHVFTLDGFLDAEEVYLQGSFNNWQEDELRMERNGNSWILPMYLRIGTHAYKYRVDGEWELDPSNPITRPDDAGFENSFMSIGDTIYFNLDRHLEAEEVFLSGDFNAWQRRELSMSETLEGWTLPYVLGPGNYEYKFIVDEEWILDSNNPYTRGTGDYKNSIRVINANQEFRLKGFSDADEVSITGSFLNWSEDGYRMQRDGEDWVINLYLPQGKTAYKFLVNGEWFKDPDNSLWEKNEYGTYNSIIWKD
jgi:hypothetical protein